MNRSMAAAILLLFASACGQAAGQGPERGAVLFADNCAPCHGAAGYGNQDVGAPAIAGLPKWYVKKQLDNYRAGIRGAHAQDVEGLKMRPMSRSLKSDEDVVLVATHVGSMPRATPASALDGNAAAGATTYAACAACHGADGTGMEALGAPPIVQLDDWYAVRQLHKFKSGVRGYSPKDAGGAQMRPMASMLADEQAMKDVVAHLRTLRKP